MEKGSGFLGIHLRGLASVGRHPDFCCLDRQPDAITDCDTERGQRPGGDLGSQLERFGRLHTNPIAVVLDPGQGRRPGIARTSPGFGDVEGYRPGMNGGKDRPLRRRVGDRQSVRSHQHLSICGDTNEQIGTGQVSGIRGSGSQPYVI